MKNMLALFMLFALGCSFIVAQSIIFIENFDSYPLHTFPPDWDLRYTGAGSDQQYCDDTNAVSGQSLHLVGSYCWSANAYYPIDLPKHVVLEAQMFLDQIVTDGCSPILGIVGLKNCDLGP